MSDIVGQVLGVSGRLTRTNKTVYDVQFSDGQTYTTFDNGIASKAQSLMGQMVTARIEQKGQYLNLLDVAPQGMLPAAAMPQAMVPGTAIAPGTPVGAAAAIPMQPPRSGGGGGGMSETDKKRITFLGSLSSATALVGQVYAGSGPEGLEEAEQNVKRLTKEYEEQAWLRSAPPPQAVPTPVATTPQQVAAEVNVEHPGAVAVGPEGAPSSAVPNW